MALDSFIVAQIHLYSWLVELMHTRPKLFICTSVPEAGKLSSYATVALSASTASIQIKWGT